MDGRVIRRILANNVKYFRENRNLTQAALAEKSDISIPFLSEIERGNKWPYPDTLAKIAEALNVKFHELFRETPSDGERNFAIMVSNEILTAQKEATDKIYKRYLC